MKNFSLEILTPERAFYVGYATSLTLPISDGSIGILADHSPLTAAICGGELAFVRSDEDGNEIERIVCMVSRGMVDVTDGRVRVLCESALLPSELESAQAKREAEHAELLLREKQSERDYVMTKLALSRATKGLKRGKNINNK